MKGSIQSRATRPKKPQASLPYSVAYGLFFSLLIGMIVIGIGSYFVYRTEDPTALILPVSYIALIIAALLCGFITVKKYGRLALTSGAIAGVALTLFCFLISLLLGRGDIPLWLSISVYAAMIALSALGGIAAGMKKRRRRAR